jgi:tyrosinase
MRIRKNVNEIKDGTLLWYSKAVEEMKKRDITDPTSWWYQAAIHGFGLSEQTDPEHGEPWSQYSIWEQAAGLPTNKVKAEALARDITNKGFWQQCQHGSWFFLPWHRMYLQYFEEIVSKTIVDLGGPEDWALPYWNYCDGNNQHLNTTEQSHALLLPPEFGTTAPNPDFPGLWMKERVHYGVSHRDAACENSMERATFASAKGEKAGFGGFQNTFSHASDTFGALESNPHNLIHVAIAGAMGDPDTAALDPIFWLHHANIDRLWQNWIEQGHSNADSSNWLNQSFDFHNANAQHVSPKVNSVLKTEELGYTYSRNYPLTTTLDKLMISNITQPKEKEMFDTIGATSSSLKLTSEAVKTPIEFLPSNKSKANLSALDSAEAPERTSVIIMLENITGNGVIAPIDVYIRALNSSERLYVGRIGLFGLKQASTPSAQHAGTGLNTQLDATEVFHALRGQANWQLEDIHIEIEPSRKLGASNATIGRISIKAEV